MKHGEESILRLDQMHPLGEHHQAFECYGYRLSDAALQIFDEWLNWQIYDTPGENIPLFRELIAEVSG